MSNIVHGRAIIKVNGKTLKSKSGATLDMGGFKKTTQVGDAGVAGFSREPVQSKIECTCIFTGANRKSDFEFDDATIEFQCDSGQIYVIPSAWNTETPQLSNDGMKLTIEGQPAEELV